MARFQKFNPQQHIHGLAEAALRIEAEESIDAIEEKNLQICIEFFEKVGKNPSELTLEDLKVLDEAGALDWSMAESPVFQSYIRRYGTPEQECRLADLNLGYFMTGRACAWKIQRMRESGELQRFQRAVGATYRQQEAHSRKRRTQTAQ